MSKNGFGIFELLLGLLIVSVILTAMLPIMKSDFSSGGQSIKNVKQQTDEKINEIELMKKQQTEFYNNSLNQE